jgi:hypothetical protein
MIKRTEVGDSIIYTLNGQLHRTNGPAYDWPFASIWRWRLYDQVHRYYGPATCYNEWFVHNGFIK